MRKGWNGEKLEKRGDSDVEGRHVEKCGERVRKEAKEYEKVEKQKKS